MVERKAKSSDGIAFSCNRRTCRLYKSVRMGSFFEGSKLSLCECMLLIHLWCKGYTENLIDKDFEFSRPTVIDWFRYCRELCIYEFENDAAMIGGPDSIV